MHDVAVALDDELFGDADRRRLGDAADVITAEIKQHQVFGQFLGIGQQFQFQRLVLFRCLAAWTGAGDRADGQLAVAHAHQDFRRGAGQLEIAEVQVIEIGRRVVAPQGAIEGERIKVERRFEAMARHDLEDVAGGDVFFRCLDHAAVIERRGRRHQRFLTMINRGRLGGQRHTQIGLDGIETAERGAIGVLSFFLIRPDRAGQQDLMRHIIEDADDRRTHETGVRQVQRIGIGGAERFHQADHVVAEDTEQAGNHRRQAFGDIHAVGGDERAQGVQGRLGFRHVYGPGDIGAGCQFGLFAETAPHQIGRQGDDRVAAGQRAALDRFEQEGIGAAARQLEVGRNRRFQVVDQLAANNIRLPGLISFCKSAFAGG